MSTWKKEREANWRILPAIFCRRMKRFGYLFGLFLLCTGFFPVQAEGYVKYDRKIFPVPEPTDLFLNSRYGRITLCQWPKDTISMEISFRIAGVEEWEKELYAGLLETKIEYWPGTVKAAIDIDGQFDRQEELTVEIVLYVPESVKTDISDQYGKISVSGYHAARPLALTSVQGEVRIDSLSSEKAGEVVVVLQQSKLEITNSGQAVIRSSYSAVNGKNARYFYIKAENSDIFLNSIDSLRSEGRSNRYRITE